MSYMYASRAVRNITIFASACWLHTFRQSAKMFRNNNWSAKKKKKNICAEGGLVGDVAPCLFLPQKSVRGLKLDHVL